MEVINKDFVVQFYGNLPDGSRGPIPAVYCTDMYAAQIEAEKDYAEGRVKFYT